MTIGYRGPKGRRAKRRHSKGNQMSRNHILALGALLWAVVAVEAIAHIVSGDWLVPAVMAIVGVSWVVLRRARWSLPKAA